METISNASELRLRELVCESLPDGQWEFNVRPYWLTNPITHVPLELDIYSDVYKLAFEYNGWQHHTANEAQGVTLESVTSQRFRDQAKYKQVAARNIHLFIVDSSMMKSDSNLWRKIMNAYKFSQTNEAQVAELAPLHVVHASGEPEAVIDNPKITIIPPADKWDMLYSTRFHRQRKYRR